jgi:hypothetical protein
MVTTWMDWYRDWFYVHGLSYDDDDDDNKNHSAWLWKTTNRSEDNLARAESRRDLRGTEFLTSRPQRLKIAVLFFWGGGGGQAGSFAHSSHQTGQSITQSLIQRSAVYNSNTVRHHFMATPTIRILSEMAFWNESQLGIFHEHQQHHKTEIFFQCHLTAPKNDWLRITVKVLIKLKNDY